ncbi:MAG: hypothetical protein JEZ06_18380 [Anaerolineaceae bacterium]|nr:hypothetical protein [Anaerolineaceae bacterium]
MKKYSGKYEYVIYFLIWLLALSLRLWNLDSGGLNDGEAIWALKALDLHRGEPGVITSNGLYLITTSIHFSIFGISNLGARFWPAIMGSMIILPVFLQRNLFGPKFAFILSVLFSMDPILVNFSREAGSSMPGIVFILLLLSFFNLKKYFISGIMLGLVLLSGNQIWIGLTILVISGFIYQLLIRRGESNRISFEYFLTGKSRLYLIFGLLGTWIIIGSGGLIYPSAINSVFNDIVSGFSLWGAIPTVSFIELGVGLLAYASLPIVFGVFGMIRYATKNENNPQNLYLSLIVIVGLVVILVFPAHEVWHLIWILIPLYVLAAKQIESLDFSSDKSKALVEKLGIVVALIMMMVINLNFRGVTNSIYISPEEMQQRIISMVAVLIVFIIMIIFIWYGWGVETTKRVFIIPVGIVLFIISISILGNSLSMSNQITPELFDTYGEVINTGRLSETFHGLSISKTGNAYFADIRLIDIQKPSLNWFIRDYPNAKIEEYVFDESQVDIIISKDENIELSSEFVGQDFVWEQKINWKNMTLNNWLQWIVFRQADLENDNFVLWSRQSLLTGD